MVIDAGSSGTRMNAFVWHPPSSSGALPILEAVPPDAAPHKVPRRALETRRAYKRVETEPGMDKFAEKLHDLGPRALEPLLGWAREVVPPKRWASTPVFLLGTAGLRKLTEADRDRVLGQARQVLGKSGFRFEAPWARVLGGSDEGVFAWVALNAAAGTLGTDRTLGALDLGGSSLQVTFSLDDGLGGVAAGSSSAPSPVNISLMGTQSTLYTHSHYHFGLDDAFERSVTILIEEQLAGVGQRKGSRGTKTSGGSGKSKDGGVSGSGEANNSKEKSIGNRRRSLLQSADLKKERQGMVIEHPCLHQGYRSQYRRIPLHGQAPVPAIVTLVGHPNRAACTRLASQVVTAPADCTSPPCVLGAPQPRAAGRFIALAGFYVVAHFFKLGQAAGVTGLRAAGEAFCPLTWSDVQARHAGEMAVETYCFRTAYIDSLISQGLGLKEEQVEIGEGTAGWTLGAALVEGHRQAGLGGAHGAGTVSINAATRWANVVESLGPHAAALVLGVLALAAVVLAAKRAHDAIVRVLRARGWMHMRRRSSSGILSAAEFAGMAPASSNSGGSQDLHGSSMFYRMFGSSKGKKVAGNGAAGWQVGSEIDSGSHDSIAAVGSGSSVVMGITRTATFSRRLSSLETGSGDR